MLICKEDFLIALREAVSLEFIDIPYTEDDIECVFSNKFESKMQRLIKSQRKYYWQLVNTASKRVAIVLLFVITIFCSILSVDSIRISALEAIDEVITKTKNIFQIAYENGIPLSEVDTEGNFEHTDFADEEKEINQDETNSVITGENFDNPKTKIYNKMLNTVDFFNTIELRAEIHMTEDEKITADYYSDIDATLAYEAIYDYGTLRFETFCSPESEFLTQVDHLYKTYNENYLMAYKREDSPYILLEERIITDDGTGDGLPVYRYRRNITNCPTASYTIVPQEIAYSYLKNFELWEISNENAEYLGRQCIEIKGKPTPYTAGKHSCDNFTMLVDLQTGILLKFEGYKNGSVSRYITVTKCVIDGEPNIKDFDMGEYSSYTAENDYYRSND